MTRSETEMPTPQRVRLRNHDYVILSQTDYDQLLASTIPQLPRPDSEGRTPAAAYIRASLARDLLLRRVVVHLTQEQLAKKARVRLATVRQAEGVTETGRLPTTRTLDKIIDALDRAMLIQIQANDSCRRRSRPRK